MDRDHTMYSNALRSIIHEPIQGPSGTYHVKNGMLYMGYEIVPIKGFADSDHAWFIFH